MGDIDFEVISATENSNKFQKTIWTTNCNGNKCANCKMETNVLPFTAHLLHLYMRVKLGANCM